MKKDKNMGKPYRLICMCTLGVFFAFVAVGCVSDKFSDERIEYDPQLASLYEIEMTLKPLTEEALIERYGARNNPFIPPKLFLNRKTFRTFEVVIVNNTESPTDKDKSIVVTLHTIRLLFGTKAVPPLTRFRLEELWESIGEKEEKVRDMSKLLHTIQRDVFPITLTVEPGTTYKGILVFSSKFPRGGEGEVEIPTYTASNKIIGVFVDSFTF